MRARIVAREVAKNLFMGSAVFRHLRSRWRGGRTTAGRLEGAAALAEVRKTVDLYLGLLEKAGLPRDVLKGRTALEVGPGANAGVALSLLALGARKVYLVDRFADLQGRAGERTLYREILAHSGLSPEVRDRLEAEAMDPTSPANEHVRFVHSSLEAAVLPEPVDLVVSRFVLQHLSDVGAAFDRLASLVGPGGLMIHYVDVETLGPLNPGGKVPLALLEFTPRAWGWMASHRGLTNQARMSAYVGHAERTGFRVKRLDVHKRMSPDAVAAARPRLVPAFRGLSDEDLAALHFSLVAQK